MVFLRNRVSQAGGITQAKKVAALGEEFGVCPAWHEGSHNDPVNQIATYQVDLTHSELCYPERITSGRVSKI